MIKISGKTIIPFCSHGGGRFGQSQTAITKLAPDAIMSEPLSIHYSGGSSLTDGIKGNGIYCSKSQDERKQLKPQKAAW